MVAFQTDNKGLILQRVTFLTFFLVINAFLVCPAPPQLLGGTVTLYVLQDTSRKGQ